MSRTWVAPGKSTLLDLLALRGGDARPLPAAAAATTTAYPPSSGDPEQPPPQLPLPLPLPLPLNVSVTAAAAAAAQQGPTYPDAYHPPSEPGCIGEVRRGTLM